MNDIKEHFLNYELSKELKELGFSELCLAWYSDKDYLQYIDTPEDNNIKVDFTKEECGFDYSNSCSAPLISQCKNWFNEKHNIDYEIVRDYDFVEEYLTNDYNYYICLNNKPNKKIYKSCNSYKEAELEAIEQCIKLIKEKQ